MTITDERPATGRPTRGTDPRLRARQLEIARAQGRRRLKILLGVLSAGVLAGGVLALLHSPLLSARHIAIAGARETARREILAVSGLAADPPLIDVNGAADAAAIERLPWVASATVSRAWPTGVRVVIAERVPTAEIALGAGRYAISDASGRVLEVRTGAWPGLVSVHGIAAIPPAGHELGATARAGVEVAGAVPVSLVERIDGIVVRGGAPITLVLDHGPTVILGNADELREKMVALATVLARVPLARVVTIDLRVPADPVLTS